MEHKKFLRLAVCGTTAIVIVAAATIHQYIAKQSEVPLPFAQATVTSLAGDLTKIGHREADVIKVTFPTGVDSEKLKEDNIYLVYVPDDAGVTTNVPFDQVLTLDANGSHDVDYFGYKYVTADAAIERQNKADPVFENRFPGQFFASAKARANDATIGNNALAAFEAANGVHMDATGSDFGAKFQKGSLYFLIVNEPGNVTLTVRALHEAASVCGNGVKETGELCDDGDTDAGDGCSATCTIESNYICSDTSPSMCSCSAIVDCAAPPDGCEYQGYSCGSCGQLICTQTSSSSPNSSAASSANSSSSVASSVTSSQSSSAAPLPVCGDGTLDQNEVCDDGDTDAGDGCSATCSVEANFRCTKDSPSVCVSYNAFVLALADTNKNGTVSDNEALLVTLDIADAPSKSYDAVKKYDINNDGVVDNTDLLAIFAELDILAP